MSLIKTFEGIRPMWICYGCHKKSYGQRETPGDPGTKYEPPDGWFRVWRGFAGWHWSCGCQTRGKERT